MREEGERLHVFWLSGFIFFGSSNGLFERIRRAIDAQVEKPVGYVVLDFGAVPGLDTSAVLSLVKLRNYCNEHDVTLVFSGLSEVMRGSFQKAGFFASGQPHQVFATRNEAVEWCEDMLLMYHEVGEASAHSFESWLTKEFGGAADMSRIAPYLERHELKVGEALFRQGEPPDSVELLASGCVAITIEDQQGRPIRLRRMMGYTIVGEMGFYRQVPRTATVIAEEPSVVYRLTRESFDRMQAQDPTAASVFHKLIIRLLSDRLEFANREISALLRFICTNHRRHTGASRYPVLSFCASRADSDFRRNDGTRSHGVSDEHADDHEISEAVHELIGAERVPEAPILRGPTVAVGHLLLQPVDMVVEQKLADGDDEREQERSRRDHKIHERRQRDVDGAVLDAAGMSVGSLVQILIGALQIEIGDRMLAHEDSDRGENNQDGLGHGLFAEGFRAAVPIGRGRVLPKEGDAFAVERIEPVEARAVHSVAFAAELICSVPVSGSVLPQELVVTRRKIDEATGLFEGIVTEQREDARGFGLAFHLQ